MNRRMLAGRVARCYIRKFPAPNCLDTGNSSVGSGSRIRTCDLWVMSQSRSCLRGPPNPVLTQVGAEDLQ
jgi:hypothetical protein